MSRAYYNENDPKAAAWLRELIRRDLIAPGEVDERDIRQVQGDDLVNYTQCHFFAGIGGWSYALRISGWPDDRPVWTGSCPCQPFSNAGKRKGTADERHLWPDFRRLIAECRPATCFGEQVASKDGRLWLNGVRLNGVRLDLEELGYAVGAADLCAAGIGAPHIRQRLFWIARERERERETAGYPTPMTDDRPGKNHGRNLGHKVVEWFVMIAGYPTPDTCQSPNGHGPRGGKAGNGSQSGASLSAIATLIGYPTPTVQDAENCGSPSQAARHTKALNVIATMLGDDSSLSPAPMEKRGVLNPALARWLMGFPPVWDDCAVTAMLSCRKSRRNSSART